MIGELRYFDRSPDPADCRAGDRPRFADLSDYYPAQSPPTQTVNGTQPAAPQNATAQSGSKMLASPVWLIAFVGAGLLLLHNS